MNDDGVEAGGAKKNAVKKWRSSSRRSTLERRLAALAMMRIILNYKDYEALPNDGKRYEIHEGELSVTPAPSPQHQRMSRELFRILDAHVRARGLGEAFYAPIDVILSDISIVQPDLVYLATNRLRLVSSRGIEGAPSLVVEILSPSTAQIDRHAKLQVYASHAVPDYWIVDGETRSIEAYSLSDGRYTLTVRAVGDERLVAPPFVDLEIALAALWA